MTYKSNITSNNPQAWLELIWNAVEFYKEEGIPVDAAGCESEREAWQEEQDDINTAMAWIAEELDVDDMAGNEDCPNIGTRETSDAARWRAEQRHRMHEEDDTLDLY